MPSFDNNQSSSSTFKLYKIQKSTTKPRNPQAASTQKTKISTAPSNSSFIKKSVKRDDSSNTYTPLRSQSPLDRSNQINCSTCHPSDPNKTKECLRCKQHHQTCQGKHEERGEKTVNRRRGQTNSTKKNGSNMKTRRHHHHNLSDLTEIDAHTLQQQLVQQLDLNR